ncbi:hypothetical protein HanIR_Chr16g0821221 [Helianthus annuus]|nr:hypothetical protein HanIR_Chr16g0821221 [Helianthus annuus]
MCELSFSPVVHRLAPLQLHNHLHCRILLYSFNLSLSKFQSASTRRLEVANRFQTRLKPPIGGFSEQSSDARYRLSTML